MADIKGFDKEELFTSGHTACGGCGEALAIRQILKASGKNTIVVQATGCLEVSSTIYPQTSWKVPYIHAAFENIAAVASGIREALNKQGKKEINVIAIGGDGATYDIGLQALSGAFERGHRFLYICLNNEAYQNTGSQRSGATEKYSWTSTTPIGNKTAGKIQHKKQMPFIVAAHKIPYVATASLYDLFDLNKKIKKALSINGPSYIEILCPCIPGWKIGAEKAYDASSLAFKSNIWPVYEIVDGKMVLRKNSNPIKIEEYLKIQGRYKHLLKPENKEILEEMQKHVNEEYRKLEEKNGKNVF